jgi:hypothetical protein
MVNLIIYFVHLLGALTVGFYILLPFVTARIGNLQPTAQAGYVRGLQQFNRIGQWLLILQFLTGGYMISKYELSVTWIVTVIVVFLLLGAVTGVLGGPFKRMIQAGEAGQSASASDISRAVLFSSIAAISILIQVFLMFFSDII